jgi:hypothetical protein
MFGDYAVGDAAHTGSWRGCSRLQLVMLLTPIENISRIDSQEQVYNRIITENKKKTETPTITKTSRSNYENNP